MQSFDTAFFSTVPSYSGETNSVMFDTGAVLLDVPNMDVQGQKSMLDAMREVLDGQMQSDPGTIKQSIDELLAKQMHEYAYAFSAFFLLSDKVFLYTAGQGAIYIHRNGEIKAIIEGNNHAIGHLQKADTILLTTKSCQKALSSIDDRIFDGVSSAQDIVSHLSSHHGMIDDLVVFLVGHVTGRETQVQEVPSDEAQVDSIEEMMPLDQEEDQQDELAPFVDTTLQKQPWLKFMSITRDKKLMIGVVVLLVALLGWSIFSGNQRRKERLVSEKAALVKVDVEKKIADAKEIAPLELSQALDLIQQAKKEVAAVEAIALKQGVKNSKQIQALQDEIAQAEKGLKKQDEVAPTEYYDLGLIDKQATAEKMSVEGDSLALLDSSKGKVYLLTGEKKTSTQYSDAGMVGATAIYLFREKIYVLQPEKGIYELENEKKPALVIKPEEWGSIKDIAVFNGNIYLFDSSKPSIYKYLVAQEGFSGKQSYFKQDEAPPGLSDGISMMIDGSLYVATPSKVLKYLSGAATPISLSPPEEMHIDDIYTQSDLDDLYVVDKSHGKVFMFTKDGSYKKQIGSSVISSSDDFGVLSDGTIIILSKNKLYKL